MWIAGGGLRWICPAARLCDGIVGLRPHVLQGVVFARHVVAGTGLDRLQLADEPMLAQLRAASRQWKDDEDAGNRNAALEEFRKDADQWY